MSYTPQIKPSAISIGGINSSNLINGPLWSGDTFLGAGEINDYNYIGVNLQTDQSGTLTFEFSQNGIDWSRYPITEFTIVSGVNEVHSAWKGIRYVRPKFTGNSGETRTYFRIKTMYSYDPIILTAPLNQTINTDSDANIVKAVSIGETPDSTYTNTKQDGLGFSTNSILLSGETYDSGILSLIGYTQVQTDVLSIGADGLVIIEFYEDAEGINLLRTLTSPYNDGDGFKLLSAPSFTPYVRYQFNCTSIGQTQFYFDTKFTTKSISGQILGLNDFVSDSMVANLGRNVIVAQQPDGDFVNTPSDGTAETIITGLTSGQTVSGNWLETDGYNSIRLFISSDQKSVDNGIIIEFTNEVQVLTPIIRATSNYTYGQSELDRGYLEINIPPKLDGLKWSYTNGETPATFFGELDLKINLDTNKYDSGGSLIVSDFKTEVSLGNVQNYSISEKFGLTRDLPISNGTDTVWPLSEPNLNPNTVKRKTFISTPSTIFISSTSVSDTNKDITLIYNDENNNEQTVTVTLNGQSQVVVGVGIDCNRGFLSSDDDELVGNVYIYQGAETNGIPNNDELIMAYITANEGTTLQATYRVPNGYKMIISNVFISMTRANGSPSSGTINLRYKPNGRSWFVQRPYLVTTAAFINKKEHLIYNSGDLIEFYSSDISDNGTNCSVIYEYQLIKN